MRKHAVKIAMVVTALAAAVAAPATGAENGPPQGGGGCHMVFGPDPTGPGLTNMMLGSAHGQGATNMAIMLSRFSSDPFCGL
jgi:hypothetical protein